MHATCRNRTPDETFFKLSNHKCQMHLYLQMLHIFLKIYSMRWYWVNKIWITVTVVQLDNSQRLLVWMDVTPHTIWHFQITTVLNKIYLKYDKLVSLNFSISLMLLNGTWSQKGYAVSHMTSYSLFSLRKRKGRMKDMQINWHNWPTLPSTLYLMCLASSGLACRTAPLKPVTASCKIGMLGWAYTTYNNTYSWVNWCRLSNLTICNNTPVQKEYLSWLTSKTPNMDVLCCLMTLGTSMDILFSMLENHQKDTRPQLKWTVSLVIADGHFNLPQGFVWVYDYMYDGKN